MKISKLQFVIFLFISTTIFSQIPNGFNYQAVAREANGSPISKKQISVRFTILQGGENGNKQYVEYHRVKTSDLGTFSAVIGTGTVKDGNFNTIDWSQGDLFLKVDFDQNGGDNYIEMGTQKLNAVPYAMYALNGKKGDPGKKGDKGEKGDRGERGKQGDSGPTYTAGSGISISANKISANDNSASNEIQTLSLSGAKLSISKGNSITLPSGNSGGASKINDLEDGKSDNNGSSIFIGRDAGKNDDGTNNKNVSLGSKSLTSNKTGDENTAIGYLSLASNTNGKTNTAIGYSALQRNTYKSGLVAIGDSSLNLNGVGATKSYHATRNTAVGSKTLANNTIGNDNTASGSETLYSNTTGSHNSAYGTKSMYKNDSGKYNTAYGHSSLVANTKGNNNTAIGYQALLLHKEGNDNTAIGRGAGLSNVSGKANVFIGYSAGLFETGSNKLYIENSNAKSTDALIYGEFDNNLVRINGKLEVTDQIKIASSNKTAEEGMIRWNKTTHDFEGFDGTDWISFTKRKTSWGNNDIVAYEDQKVEELELNSLLGTSVSVSLNFAFLGTPGYSDTKEGKVHIMKRNGTIWDYSETLTLSSGQGRDYFGQSVAISGKYAVVGAPGNDVNGVKDKGSVHIYKLNGNSWKLQRNIYASDGKSGDSFGESVAISGNYAVVGAPGDYFNNGKGSFYVYKRNGSSWELQQRIYPSNSVEKDFFGFSVSIDGDYITIGSFQNAYVYKRIGNNWQEQSILETSDELLNIFHVDISNDYIVVGAPRTTVNGRDYEGAVYIYKRNGNKWQKQTTLYANDKNGDYYFGDNVAIAGNHIVITRGDNNRYAYVYKRKGTNWIEEVKLKSSNGEENDYFGGSLSIDDNYILIGASTFDDGTGSVYFYKRN